MFLPRPRPPKKKIHNLPENTQVTCISIMFDTITRLTQNVWLPHLHMLMNSTDHIHSDQVKEDVIETLLLHYFEYKKKLRPDKIGNCHGKTVRYRRTEQRLPAPRPGHHSKDSRWWQWLSKKLRQNTSANLEAESRYYKKLFCYLHV